MPIQSSKDVDGCLSKRDDEGEDYKKNCQLRVSGVEGNNAKHRVAPQVLTTKGESAKVKKGYSYFWAFLKEHEAKLTLIWASEQLHGRFDVMIGVLPSSMRVPQLNPRKTGVQRPVRGSDESEDMMP